MTYFVGERIDLSYLNRRLIPDIKKKDSFQETASTLYEIGTQFIFNSGKASRKIPVAFA